MDKNTLSNYGWIVIAVLVLSVMIALATPFGEYIKAGVESTTAGLFDTSEKALNIVGMSAKPDPNIRDNYEHTVGYVNYNGTLSTNKDSIYLRIPVQEGEFYHIWYPEERYLSAGNGGAVRFENDSNEMVSMVSMHTSPRYNVNPKSNIAGAVIKIPSGISYMCVNLKMVGQFDFTKTAYIAKPSTFKGDNAITLVTIGDSITEFNHTANKNWTLYAKESLNALHLNLGSSGKGYMYQGGFSQYFNKLTADAELVVFYGSFNDMTSITDGAAIGSATDVYVEGANNSLAACMNYAYDYVKTNCPNAKIAVIAPAPWKGHKNALTDETTKQAQYVAVMQEICESKDIPFLDLFHTSGMTPWDAEYNATYYYNADGCHPNDEGQKILASKITPFLQDVLK